MPKGSFDAGGAIPHIDDARVSFIKGWFWDTWPQLGAHVARQSENLIVHYDADLYSSTLFALAKIDTVGKAYTAIFDEFTGHEARALHNYVQSHGAKVNFIGKIIVNGYPVHVSCSITPVAASSRSIAA
jgi:hypothetical protein